MARILNLGVCVIIIALLSAVVPVAATMGRYDPVINNSLQTAAQAPTIVFTDQTVTSIVCNPDGTSGAYVQVTVATPNGNGELQGVSAVLTDGVNTLTVTLGRTGTTDAKTTTWDGFFDVPYWFAPGDMQITATATTFEPLTGTATTTCTFGSALGITVDTPNLAFTSTTGGPLTYGQTSSDQVATVHNSANSAISSVTGQATDWASDSSVGSTMPASALHLSTPDTPMSNSADTTLSGALGVQTSAGTLSTANTAFHVLVPASSPDFTMDGNYSSVTSLTAWA